MEQNLHKWDKVWAGMILFAYFLLMGSVPRRLQNAFAMLHNLKQKQDNAPGCDNTFATQRFMSPQGKMAFLQPHLQQQPGVVADIPESQVKRRMPVKEIVRITGNTLASIVVAFFPKCPVCWAGYMSLFGAIGLQSIPYTPQVLFLFIAGMAVNLYVHYRISRKRHRMRAFVLNLVGVAAVICGYFFRLTVLSYSGIILLIISSLFINLRWSGFSRKKKGYR